MNNQEIRKAIKDKLNTIEKQQYEKWSKVICNRLVRYFESSDRQIKRVLCFYPTDSEPDLKFLYDFLLSKGFELYFPVSGIEGNMAFYRIENMNQFISGKFGIFEPDISIRKEENIFNADGNYVCITPLVGFDENLNRIGHGAGYYDRWFAKHPSKEKIGVAFELQKQEIISSMPWDIPLNMVVTEERVYAR